MGNYQGYQKYKNSGVEWLGDIPEHWKFIPLKFLIHTRKGVAFKSSDFTDRGCRVVKASDIKNYSILESNIYLDESFKQEYPKAVLKEGEIVLSTVGSTPDIKNSAVGQVGIVPQNLDQCLLNQNTVVFKPDVENLLNEYLFYILTSNRYRDHLGLYAHGTANQASLNISDMLSFQSPIPPLDEQEKIAQFLDYKTKQIDELIKKKETLIEKLDEKRTALISHAVTKGLDSSVPMKDSGIEWLGEIPKHWEVKRLRYIGSFQNGISKGADYFGFGYPFVNYTDVYANLELPKIVNGLANSTDEDRINYSVKTGDVFFTRTSETIEEIGITSTCFNSIDNATFSGFLIRVRPFSNLIFPGFSKYYFRCQLHRFFFVKEMNLVTRASLSQELLKRLPVLLPPLEEQEAITNLLDQKTTKIDLQKAKIKEAIELLKEYRTSLITNAVTGKIDVRQIDIP
ncbi:restriction endonuclease subunit S [Anabaena catenula FACHB-362]|uniref:Restriction endonuclease subunit S n=2 Tax=Anabaena TaxID=1163 RepID=A0ABR8JBH3_9NOST|nr:restriction endonuclease subunit S [Anabaena catenula]MBD2694860.1 restriction endonuclease subunit S [Anabaena catenula FACHB-362]